MSGELDITTFSFNYRRFIKLPASRSFAMRSVMAAVIGRACNVETRATAPAMVQ
jgi:hypothetical protein